MADPLSVISGIAGVITFATSTTNGLVSLIQEIRDAPEDLCELNRELNSLSSALDLAQQLCMTYDMRIDDVVLIETVSGYVETSSTIIQDLKNALKPFVNPGWRRRPMRVIGWTMRKGDIKAQRSRLRDGTASLTLAVSVLNGHLAGKGQDEIRNDIAIGFEQLTAQFQSVERGRRLRFKLESDLESVTTTHRVGPESAVTDTDFAVRNFLQEQRTDQIQEEVLSVNSAHLRDADETLLIQASRAGNRAHILELLLSGADTLERGVDGRTSLHYAAIHDDGETIRLLLDHGADINAKDNALDTPFSLAISGVPINIQAAAVLVEKGCAIGNFPFRLVQTIVLAEEPASLRQLISPILKRRLNLGARGPFMLHQAITIKDDACLEILLEEGLDPDQKDTYGIPVLFHAALHRKRTAMQIVLNHGGDVDVYMPRWGLGGLNRDQDYLMNMPDRSSRGETLLSLSAFWGDIPLSKYLLKAGANPNLIYPDSNETFDPSRPIHAQGENLLHGVCAGHLLDHAKLLIEVGIDINRQVVSTGQSPLYWCIICSNMELLRILFENGVEVNATTTPAQGRMSALHIAIQYGRVEMARMLIEHGANLEARNGSNETPREQAQRSGNGPLISLFD